jgi:hypothetical protein
MRKPNIVYKAFGEDKVDPLAQFMAGSSSLIYNLNLLHDQSDNKRANWLSYPSENAAMSHAYVRLTEIWLRASALQ